MRTNFTLLFAALLLGITGCEDHRPAPESSATCHVVKNAFLFPASILPFAETLDYAGSTYRLGINDYQTFQYDANGRVMETQDIFSIDPQGNLQSATSKSTYEYSPTQIKETRYPVGATSPSLITYTLNNQGYITRGNGNSYQYDNNGYLVKRTNSVEETTYTTDGGNLKERVSVLKTPSYKQTTVGQYEYNMAKPNFSDALQQPYYLVDPGQQAIAAYFGKISQNLLVKATTTLTNEMANGSVFKSTAVTNYIYSYDGQGKIKRVLAYTVNTSGEFRSENVAANDFTYDCPR